MATQYEVFDFIKSNYQCEELTPNVLRLVFTTGEGNRSQLVFAFVLEETLIVQSPFASKEALTPVQALNAARETFLGMTTAMDGFYALVNSFPIADIDSSEIEWCLQIVASQADLIENNSTGGDEL